MKRFLLLTLLFACKTDPADPKTTLARELREACSVANTIASRSPVAARDACADALTDLPSLRALKEPVLWGGQPPGAGAEDLLYTTNLTDFQPRVWRRMYLSTFMFEDADPIVRQDGDYTLVSVPVRFRNSLDAGEYPYPFWHSQNKWTSYERATHLVFVFDRDGKIPAVVRSETQDAARPHVERTFDGMWRWDGGAQPRVVLYSYLFSADNPHVARLDAAYRALEEGLREHDCTMCHDPTNAGGAKHLELLSYPNQALAGRHDAVKQVERMFMPPAMPGIAMGIPDAEMRADLIAKIREFADAGDAALAFDEE